MPTTPRTITRLRVDFDRSPPGLVPLVPVGSPPRPALDRSRTPNTPVLPSSSAVIPPRGLRPDGPVLGARCAPARGVRLPVAELICHFAISAAEARARLHGQRPASPGPAACRKSACRGPLLARFWPYRP